MKKLIFSIITLTIIAAGCVKDRLQSAVVIGPVTSDTLMYYWNFNNADSSNHDPDFFVNTGARFNYYCSYIDYTTGSPLNLHMAADSGSCLRLRNPSDSVIFHMPTTGYDSLTLSFAERRSNSGPSSNIITYTVDGSHFTNTAIGANTYTIDTLFNQYTYVLGADPAINNNPKFAVKLTFANNNTGTTGNSRIDNFSLKGKKR